MSTQNYILVEQFCTHHNIPVSFVNALSDYELIEIIAIDNANYIQDLALKDLEKMTRLHFELNINLEGLDAIYHLLKQVETLQQDIVALNNKLSRFNKESD